MKLYWFILLGALVFCVTYVSSAFGKDLGQRDKLREIFVQGNDLYLNREYSAAIEEYQKLLNAGLRHPDVYFNLANAYYRTDRKGLAVLFYEKALKLDPNDSGSLSNLALVQKELVDRVVIPQGKTVGEPLWHDLICNFSINVLTWTFILFYCLFFGLLVIRVLISKGKLKHMLFWFNVVVVCIVVGSGLLLTARIYVYERVHHAVVVANKAEIREGPEQNAGVLLEVHEGLKVRLLNEMDAYVRIRLANGVEGFLVKTQIGRI